MRHALLFLSAATLALAGASAEKPAKAEEAGKAAGSRDEVVCKKFAEVGSLVKSKRICKTRWEWERDRDDARANAGGGFCGNDGGRC